MEGPRWTRGWSLSREEPAQSRNEQPTDHRPQDQPQRRNSSMTEQLLITGGAGFLGSHLADELLRHGYRVRALDSLSPQVHGPDKRRPAYLSEDVELVVGDVCDARAVRRALKGVDAVFPFAAAVGVGQCMYEGAHYTKVNNLCTAAP